MKTQWMVTVLLSMIFFFSINSFAYYEPTTSYYGHGEYYCYYLNVQTHQFYKGISSKKREAKQKAHDACLLPVKGDDRENCEFADCRFK